MGIRERWGRGGEYGEEAAKERQRKAHPVTTRRRHWTAQEQSPEAEPALQERLGSDMGPHRVSKQL